MKIIPTIHIKNGQMYCPTRKNLQVRNVYTSSPVKLSAIWEEKGASMINVVDVDGAILGYPVNTDIVREILNTVKVPVQYGGGIRTVKDADNLLNMGITRLYCGTMSTKKPKFMEDGVKLFGSDKFMASIDAKNGMVLIEGREKLSPYNTMTVIKNLKDAGITSLIYTDVVSANIHMGPSLENTQDIVKKSRMKLYLCGGIHKLKDIEQVSTIGVEGVIIASALYYGEIDLREAIDLYEKD
ncbi:MAG: hypothetical protein IJL97_03675 [Lachnospiraceae bacterium]|nr:hypothetical protein [Lachnospiraceae bacterium]